MAGTLTRWGPFAEFGGLRSDIDRVLNDWLDGGGRARVPEIDVVRDDGNLVVRADMPGIRPEEVKIEIEEGVLTIAGEHEESSDVDEKDFVRHERRRASFHRSLTLPVGVKADDVTATTRDGVVQVIVPLPAHAHQERVTITPTLI